MHTTTDHVNEGCDQTADMLNLRPKRLSTRLPMLADKVMRAQTSPIT